MALSEIAFTEAFKRAAGVAPHTCQLYLPLPPGWILLKTGITIKIGKYKPIIKLFLGSDPKYRSQSGSLVLLAVVAHGDAGLAFEVLTQNRR